jgi:hypothetical protein
MHDGIGGRRGGGMSGGDLVARWTRYLNEFMAEWTVPEDLVYALGEPGQEPIPVLNPTDARFYASWLRLHGYMTTTEWRWLWVAIAHHEAGSGDEA